MVSSFWAEYRKSAGQMVCAGGLVYDKAVFGFFDMIGVLLIVVLGVDGIRSLFDKAFADVEAVAKGVHQRIRPFVEIAVCAGDMRHGRKGIEVAGGWLGRSGSDRDSGRARRRFAFGAGQLTGQMVNHLAAGLG